MLENVSVKYKKDLHFTPPHSKITAIDNQNPSAGRTALTQEETIRTFRSAAIFAASYLRWTRKLMMSLVINHLLSFLPLMAGVPSELAIEARYKITEVFRSISAARQTSLSAISPASASAASPVSIITNVSDTSEENFNILDFCHLQYS
jgi:hypothetical protein